MKNSQLMYLCGFLLLVGMWFTENIFDTIMLFIFGQIYLILYILSIVMEHKTDKQKQYYNPIRNRLAYNNLDLLREIKEQLEILTKKEGSLKNGRRKTRKPKRRTTKRFK